MGGRTLIFDVETTGLAAYDRVISLAGIWCDGIEPTGEDFYLVFNPGKLSHPAAAAAHGLADWWLRYQPVFACHADDLAEAFARADLVVGHNVGFDLRMMNHEFGKCGAGEIAAPFYCTMQGFQARLPGERANLDSCLAHIGMKRSARVHSAYEDAFLTMNLYRWLNGGSPRPSAPARLPSNGVAPPPEVAWAVAVDSTGSGQPCPPPPEQVVAMLAQWGIDITGHSPRTVRKMLAAHDYALMLARRIPAESQAQIRALICALADAEDFREPLLEWSRWAWGRSNPQLPRNALRRFAEEMMAALV